MALKGSLKTTSFDGRYYQVSWTATQSIENNQSTISWTLKALGGNESWYAERTLEVALGGGSVYSKQSRVERYAGTITSGTKVIKHDENGNATFGIGIRAAVFTSTVNCTGSANFTLDTIPRRSELSVENGTLGTAQTLNVTRKSTDFKHTITYTCGSASGTICTKSTDTAISFTPPLSLASQNTTGTTVSITYKIETFDGSTSIGSNSYTNTCSIPKSVKPSVTLTIEEGTNQQLGVYVQDISKLKVAITATESYGSAIASYKTTIGSNTYTKSTFTTSILTTSGDLTITTTVTDNRGRTATATKTINVLEYNNPAFNLFKVNRCSADGTENMLGEYGKVYFDCTCSGLNGHNEVYFDIECKRTNEDKYTLCDRVRYGVVDGSTGVLTAFFPADSAASYHVRIVAYDALKSTSQVTVLSTGFSIFHWISSGLGFAIGKLAELANFLDIGWDTIFRKNIHMGYYHDDEKSINFKNDASNSGKTYKNDGVYPHNCNVFSGSSTNPIGIGMYDADNGIMPFAYNDNEKYVYTEAVFRHQIAVAYPSETQTLQTTEWSQVVLDTINPPELLGSYLELVDGGIKCKKAGFVKFSAQCYVTGLTAYDTIGVGVQKNSSSMCSWFYRKQNHTTMYNSVTDYVVEVKEGDMLHLAVRNSTAVRGAIESGRGSTRMVVEYVG